MKTETTGQDGPIVVDEPRGQISPFVPGSIVTGASLVIDKHGCAWWVRPDSMIIIRANPSQIKTSWSA